LTRVRWLLAALAVAGLCMTAFATYQRVTANPGCAAGARCVRVLFLGNSYTSVNDLPDTLARLAWSGGHRIETAAQAPGGWTLLDQVSSPDTARLLTDERWDYVVLQEQSEIPSVESLRQSEMYPAVRRLLTMIRDAGASALLFVTWAHRAGWPENGMPDYASMQAAIDDGYRAIAGEEHAAIVPVGPAWLQVVAQESKPDLWQDDGSHPTGKGTYLAACVFYAAIFGQSPLGLGWHPWLSGTDAEQVQRAAATTVLDNRAEWGLP
jgi:uncharacterized protein DUF4886